MIRFFAKIFFWIQYFIIDPIIAFFNYHFRHKYVIDNVRNQAVMDYLVKILDDPNYQPQTAYEHFCEDRLRECHERVMAEIRAGKYPGIPSDTEINYEEQRQSYAYQSYMLMHKRMFIKER